MNTDIDLIHNYRYKWVESQNIRVKGFVDSGNRRLEGEEMIHLFKNIDSPKAFNDLLHNLDGCFGIILEANGQVMVGVDRIRMFPLFYYFHKNCLYISDDAETLKNKAQINDFDDLAEKEFLATGIVPRNNTLIKGVKQIMPGQSFIFDDHSIKQSNYFQYATSFVNDYSYNHLKNSLINILNQICKDIINKANGKMIAVPLSGGFDSRLIAVLLREFGYNNVLCYTYGRKANNNEINISKQVAERLGFKWQYIEYNDELIKNYLHEDVFEKYYRYLANYSNQFIMQEYFAVKYLKEHNLIDEDTIFMPGFAGDFLGGSHITKFNLKKTLSSKYLPVKLYYDMYTYIKPSNEYKKCIFDRLRQDMANTFRENPSFYTYSVFENWDYKEKLSKFIFNSARVYSYFGFSFDFPYWKKNLIDFFKQLPIKHKKNRALYFDVLKNYYFKKYSLNFDYELQPSYFQVIFQYQKNIVKRFLPEGVKRKFSSPSSDIYFYHAITDYMVKDMASKGKFIDTSVKNYNSIITQWYLHKIKS